MPIEQSCPSLRKQLSAAERAMRLLARRGYSEKELTRKLYSYGCYSSLQIREAVEMCRKHRFLDDETLAQDYAGSLNERNCGSRKIRMQLKKRGIAEDVADSAVEQILPLEEDAAMRALEYKSRLLARETDPLKKRQKLFRYLASRGFPFDVINRCLEKEC